MRRLERGRCAIAERRMEPHGIVERLNVVGHVSRRGRVGGPPTYRKLLLQRAKATLDDGAVPAIAAATHAGDEAVRREQRLIRGAGVLRAAVGVMQQPTRGTAA